MISGDFPSASHETPEENAYCATVSLEFNQKYRAWIDSQKFSHSAYDCEEIAVGFSANLIQE